MMLEGESDDGSIECVDVGQIAFRSARVRNREFRLDRCVEFLLGEQPPVVHEAIVLLSSQLGAPGSVVEPFVAPEEQRRHRATEAERVSPVVGGGETAIDTYSNRASTIGAIEK